MQILREFYAHARQLIAITHAGIFVHQSPSQIVLSENGASYQGGSRSHHPEDGVQVLAVIVTGNKSEFLYQVF